MTRFAPSLSHAKCVFKHAPGHTLRGDGEVGWFEECHIDVDLAPILVAFVAVAELFAAVAAVAGLHHPEHELFVALLPRDGGLFLIKEEQGFRVEEHNLTKEEHELRVEGLGLRAQGLGQDLIKEEECMCAMRQHSPEVFGQRPEQALHIQARHISTTYKHDIKALSRSLRVGV